jgi:hypothetical protein
VRYQNSFCITQCNLVQVLHSLGKEEICFQFLALAKFLNPIAFGIFSAGMSSVPCEGRTKAPSFINPALNVTLANCPIKSPKRRSNCTLDHTNAFLGIDQNHGVCINYRRCYVIPGGHELQQAGNYLHNLHWAPLLLGKRYAGTWKAKNEEVLRGSPLNWFSKQVPRTKNKKSTCATCVQRTTLFCTSGKFPRTSAATPIIC